MSADNGYVIQRNSKGRFVLQMYFASNDGYPDPDVDQGSSPTYGKLEDAIVAYEQGDYWSEYGLSFNLNNYPTLRNTKKKETLKMETSKFVKKPFVIDAIRVTADNMEKVTGWCEGIIRNEPKGAYIYVEVKNALTPRQKKAFIGDWVLYLDGKGFKVYTDSAFRSNFVPHGVVESAVNIFDDSADIGTLADSPVPSTNVFDVPQELLTTTVTVSPSDAIAGSR